MCFPSLFIQMGLCAHKLFFPAFIYRVLTYLGLENFPALELVHVTAPIGATFLKQRQAQMKSVEPSTGFSKRPRVEDTIAAPASNDQPVAVDTIEEIHVDPTIAMDPTSDAKTVDPTVTPPLSLCAMMETFMTTLVAHEQLIDELLTKFAALKADFAKYRSAFPPSQSGS